MTGWLSADDRDGNSDHVRPGDEVGPGDDVRRGEIGWPDPPAPSGGGLGWPGDLGARPPD